MCAVHRMNGFAAGQAVVTALLSRKETPVSSLASAAAKFPLTLCHLRHCRLLRA